MRMISVEPAMLENSASIMESYNNQYQETFMRLYQTIETLSASWQGSDNTAFVNQIQGYHDDFSKMSLLMSQYSEFLRSSARAYRQTQNELTSEAARLTN